MNLAGVRRVGDVFRASLDSLGFTTRWVPQDGVHRAGHLVAEHRGRPGRTRILLLGHLDTVYEGDQVGWRRVGSDSMARGAGAHDMKGGNVVLLYALRAMAHAGELEHANVTVILTGDEEEAGEPYALSRGDLLEAGRHADVALSFESGGGNTAVVARRSAGSWRLEVTGHQAHSSGVFREGVGYGAIYEMARILDGFRTRLAGPPTLTFNPGTVVGGTEVTLDSAGFSGTAAGKTNIVAPRAIVQGDLRTLSDAERDSARAVMREIVAASLPGTHASIAFDDGYPSMSPTEGNARILGLYSAASEALGYGAVGPNDPIKRGAGDISFIAAMVPGLLDGLGADGSGDHSPEEVVNLNSLVPQTQRAAVLMARLGRERRP
jgi:glutamate carboxypeptidase